MNAAAIREVIDRAAEHLHDVGDSPRLDAEILLATVLEKPRSWLIARPEQSLDPQALQRFQALLARRAEGHPVAHLIGTREFWSRRFLVTADTLIPRPETEHLIEAALERLPVGERRTIADLGTGSGVIALTLALERPDCAVTATDISAQALAVARDNAVMLGVTHVTFRRSDWFSGLEGVHFDLIASNPPYVSRHDPHMSRGDLRFEPEIALTAGDNGLEAIERLVAGARDHLAADGWLILEHGFDQADAVASLLERYGYSAISSITDFGGHARIAAAQWKGQA